MQNLLNQGFLNINLEEKVYVLDEVTVNALLPEELLSTAIKRIPYQFSGDKPLELEYY